MEHSLSAFRVANCAAAGSAENADDENSLTEGKDLQDSCTHNASDDQQSPLSRPPQLRCSPLSRSRWKLKERRLARAPKQTYYTIQGRRNEKQTCRSEGGMKRCEDRKFGNRIQLFYIDLHNYDAVRVCRRDQLASNEQVPQTIKSFNRQAAHSAKSLIRYNFTLAHHRFLSGPFHSGSSWLCGQSFFASVKG